jgi:ornithine cyclodeaminase
MPSIKTLTEAELRDLVGLDADVVARIEDAFRALATKPVVMPPILHLEIADHNGEFDVKTAYVPGVESFAIKMSGGFFDNPKLGLPSLGGLMVVFSARTGQVEALLLDNGYLTDIRTAAAGAVAARWLSREDSARAGIVGTGLQARLQAKALTLVRPISSFLIWGRRPDKAAALARELTDELGLPADATESLGGLVEASDIVVTTTPSKEPLIEQDWLHPGLHDCTSPRWARMRSTNARSRRARWRRRIFTSRTGKARRRSSASCARPSKRAPYPVRPSSPSWVRSSPARTPAAPGPGR